MGRETSEALAHVDALRQLIDEHNDVATLLDSAAVLREAAHRIRDRTGLDVGYAAQIESSDLLVIRGWSGACSRQLDSARRTWRSVHRALVFLLNGAAAGRSAVRTDVLVLVALG